MRVWIWIQSKWENRLFTVWLEPSVLKSVKEVLIKGVHEYNNEIFGEVNFINENAYPEIKKLNGLVKINPENHADINFKYNF